MCILVVLNVTVVLRNMKKLFLLFSINFFLQPRPRSNDKFLRMFLLFVLVSFFSPGRPQQLHRLFGISRYSCQLSSALSQSRLVKLLLFLLLLLLLLPGENTHERYLQIRGRKKIRGRRRVSLCLHPALPLPKLALTYRETASPPLGAVVAPTGSIKLQRVSRK